MPAPSFRLMHCLAVPALAVAMLGMAGSAARADSIDGNWCNSTNSKMMQISGTTIITPGGQKTEGRYSRHAFAYAVPDSGEAANLQLVSENRIIAQIGAAPQEMWHRCEQTS